MVISGDSTSRRLNNALCNFLLNNLTSYVCGNFDIILGPFLTISPALYTHSTRAV